MKTQEEYAREIDEIVRRDVESCQIDWFKIDKEIFMLPENKNKTFIHRNDYRVWLDYAGDYRNENIE